MVLWKETFSFDRCSFGGSSGGVFFCTGVSHGNRTFSYALLEELRAFVVILSLWSDGGGKHGLPISTASEWWPFNELAPAFNHADKPIADPFSLLLSTEASSGLMVISHWLWEQHVNERGLFIRANRFQRGGGTG